MSRYAENTEVSVEKSRSEIERIVSRYGASSFVSGFTGNRAQIVFEMRNRRIRFALVLPNKEQFRNTPTRRYARSPEEQNKAWEQGCRQKWRALALAIKAKMESVESGIAQFDEEFLPWVVLPTGLTIAETLLPTFDLIAATGDMPPMLPGPGQSTAQ